MGTSFVAVVIAGPVFLIMITPVLASAAWPGSGRALCTAPGLQGAQAIAADGAGGAIVTWQDRRSLPFNLFAQHVLASGDVDAAWPADGRALMTEPLAVAGVPEGQETPAIVADGAGGAIVTWPDGRSGLTGLDLFAQHVLATGTVDGAWPVNGVAVCAIAGQQVSPVIVSDGVRGAIVTWMDDRGGSGTDIFAQHVLASGVVDSAWPANGVAICTAPASQVSPAVIEDGAGGEIVTWYDQRSGVTGLDIFAQHVLGSGAVDPAWPANGRALCTAAGTQIVPEIAPDGAQGAIVTWTDARDGTNHIYAQHVLASGAIAAGWPVDGRAVSTSGIDEVGPTLVADGTGGVIIAWGDARFGFHDMRVHHLLGSGALDAAWPADGTAMSNAASEETFQSMVSDGARGAIVAWQRGFDIFAHHVLGSGALDPAYAVNGRAVCAVVNLQQEPKMVATGAGGAIVAWRDRRDGNDDVYALQVLEAGATDVGPGVVPGGFAFAPPGPNPAHGAVELQFTLPHEARVRLEIYDASGRRVRRLASGTRPAGSQSTAWDLRDEAGRTVRAGLYFARLESEGHVLLQKIATLR